MKKSLEEIKHSNLTSSEKVQRYYEVRYKGTLDFSVLNIESFKFTSYEIKSHLFEGCSVITDDLSVYQVHKDGSIYKEHLEKSSPPLKVFDPIEGLKIDNNYRQGKFF